jgi:hypothetical protein
MPEPSQTSQEGRQKQGAYAEGFSGVLSKISNHRTQYSDQTGILLHAAAHLDEVIARRVTAGPYIKPDVRDRRPIEDIWSKRLELSQEFEGKSELLVIHGLCIARMRRDAPPPETVALFHRMWRDHGAILIENLNMRWMISAAATFGDHGETEVQRKVGSNLEMLFGMFKLYESERIHAGHAPDEPQGFRRAPALKLPFGLTRYAVAGGDLDQQLLGKLYLEACDDATIEPLAHHLLERLISTPKSLFARLRQLRERRARRRQQENNPQR